MFSEYLDSIQNEEAEIRWTALQLSFGHLVRLECLSDWESQLESIGSNPAIAGESTASMANQVTTSY